MELDLFLKTSRLFSACYLTADLCKGYVLHVSGRKINIWILFFGQIFAVFCLPDPLWVISIREGLGTAVQMQVLLVIDYRVTCLRASAEFELNFEVATACFLCSLLDFFLKNPTGSYRGCQISCILDYVFYHKLLRKPNFSVPIKELVLTAVTFTVLNTVERSNKLILPPFPK